MRHKNNSYHSERKNNMANTYVKNYSVGQIRLDAPYSHFIHELPLLSFGDIQRSINLSLVYQSKMTGNPFYIADGYKLNLQQRLIFDAYIFLEDTSGKLIKCIGENGVYALSDDSKRILRYNADSSTYTLENPDLSKNVFDANGKVLKAYDKYNLPYLTYNYNNEKLWQIVYREELKNGDVYNKTINIDYNSPGNIKSISYMYEGIEKCKTEFIYNSNGTSLQTIQHYTGVDFNFSLTNNVYTIQSANRGAEYSNDFCQKAISTKGTDSITISSYTGSKLIDQSTYSFVKYAPNYNTYNEFCVLEITDRHGVKSRIQYENQKPLYSYEIGASENDLFTSYGAFKANVNTYNAHQIVGTKIFNEGHVMSYSANGNTQTWQIDANQIATEPSYYVISGWLKTSLNDFSTEIIIGNNTYVHTVQSLPVNKWMYFSFAFKSTSAIITATITCPESSLATKDFRIVAKSERLSVIEDVLIDMAGNISLINEFTFWNGSQVIEEPIYAGDVIKYRLNLKRGENTGEFYYNDCRGVITGISAVKVNKGGALSLPLTNYTVGKRYYRGNKTYLQKVIFNPTEAGAYISTENIVDGASHSKSILNSNLDTITSIVDGVPTYISRNEKGLITSKNLNNYIINYIAYDQTNSKVLTSTNEFGTVTTYVTDDVWGVITSVSSSDGTTVTDNYDADMSALTSKTFSKGSLSKTSAFEYTNGNLSTLTQSDLNYGFGYTTGDLAEVRKLGSIIENHALSNNDKTLTSSYPTSTSPVYSFENKTDNYGRLTEITGLIKNTYGIDTTGYSSESDAITNGSSKLAISSDLETGEKTKYIHDDGKIKKVGTFNSSGEKIMEQAFTYDSIGRVTADEFIYNIAGSNGISGDITYSTETDSASPNARVAIYSYKVNGTEKAKTQNRYNDTYKRLTAKLTTIGSVTYDKGFTYDKTRVSKVMDVKNGSTFRNVSYTYDAMGRILGESDSADTSFNNTYVYDAFGQLIRENNKSLDKTFIYEYNEIGNIIAAKTYAYTTGDIGNLTPESTDTYSYDTTHKDRLSAFNGNPISYNTTGCPSSYQGVAWSWKNGRLDTISNGAFANGKSYSFTYDGYGRLKQKQYNYFPGLGVLKDYLSKKTTTYTYDTNGRLVYEYKLLQYSDNTNTYRKFTYLYDESGIVGVVYNNNGEEQTYHYSRNIKGDVIGIFDVNGAEIVKYSYDSWGNFEITTGSLTNIAKDNPILYRGYYYDHDTELYLLDARFYNPKWRRFISPDDTAYLDPETPNGLNLYAYCNNDPVNYSDPSGNIAISTIATAMLIGFGIGFAIGGIFEIGKQINNNGWDPSNWDGIQILRSALGGGVAGAISSMMPSANYFVTFLLGGLGSVAGGLISGSVNSWETGVLAFLIGGTANILGKFVSDQIKYFDAVEIKARSISKMSAKKKSLAIWKMLGTDKSMRNAYKDWTYELIFDVVLEQPMSQHFISSLNDLSRYMLYSSLTSTLCSGWY